MARTPSNMISLGSIAPDFNLIDVTSDSNLSLKENKEWAVAQLKADPIKPILVFKDLIFDSEEKAMMKAAELRISNPGPTRLPGETLSDVPEKRRKADSLALKKEFELKLAGVRK